MTLRSAMANLRRCVKQAGWWSVMLPPGVALPEAREAHTERRSVGDREGNSIMSRNVVILGTQWGDEGKGKIADLLTEQADAVVRFQGGPQRRPYAGHWR